METLQEVAHAKTWCGQVQLARWGQLIFKVASKENRKCKNFFAVRNSKKVPDQLLVCGIGDLWALKDPNDSKLIVYEYK